jgi:hypothetical protein
LCDSGFGGFFPLPLSFCHGGKPILPAFFSQLGRTSFGLLDNFLRLLFSLLDFLYQFHFYPYCL